jgi:hypothetical protein
MAAAMRRSLRQPPIDRALAALRPACFQRPPAPPPSPEQVWAIGSPSWEGTVGPDVLQWRPTRVDRLPSTMREVYLGGVFVGFLIDTASDKSLS